MKSRPDSSLLLLAAAAAAATAAAGALVFLLSETVAAERASATGRAKIVLAERRDRVAAGVEAALEETSALRSELESFFIGEDGAVAFIETIESLARDVRADLKIGSVSIAPAASPSLEVLRMALKAEGSWQATTRLLALIDALPLVHTLEAVSLERRDEGSSWTLVMTLGAHKIKKP